MTTPDFDMDSLPKH